MHTLLKAISATGTRLGVALAAVVVAGFLVGWSLMGSIDTASGDSPQPPGPRPGIGVLDEATTTGELAITSVRASAFTTTVDLELELEDPIESSTTVFVSDDDINVDGFENAVVTSVARASDDLLRIVVSGAPIAPDETEIRVDLNGYTLAPASSALIHVSGAWGAEATLRDNALPSTTALAIVGRSRVDTADELVFIVDSISFDGTATEVRYHVQGDLEGLQFLPGPPNDPAAIPGIDVAAPSTSGTVLVQGYPIDGVLRFPSAFRRVERQLDVTLDLGDDAPAVVNTPDGRFVARIIKADRGQTIVEITSDEILPTLSPGSTKGVGLHDDLGNVYPLERGRITTPARWDDPRPGRVQMAFTGDLPPEARQVTLTLPTYDELIIGDWSIQTSLPRTP